MTKKSRTILFSILSVVFVIVASSAIFYAQGYRFDAKSFKFLKTGAIFVKVSPSNAKITLDQKPMGRTQIISDYLFIQSLVPKEYVVKAEKEGYLPWTKTLAVKAMEVSEARNVVLFPENINFPNIKNGLEKMQYLGEDRAILTYAGSDGPSKLSIYDLSNNQETDLSPINSLLAGYDLADLKILDPQNLLLSLQNKKTKKTEYFLAGVNSSQEVPQKVNFLTQDSRNVVLIDSSGERSLFWQEEGWMLKKSLDSGEPAVHFLNEKIAAFALSGNYFYFLTEKGQLLEIDQNKNFPAQELAKNVPVGLLEMKDEHDLELLIFGNKIMLNGKGNLYLLDRTENSFKKIFEGVKNIELSPSKDKILCQLQKELWVILLSDIDVPFKEKEGAELFISRFSQEIQDADWIANDYFAFSVSNQIKISEIDNRSQPNIYDISKFNDPKLLFDQKAKKLYILSDGSLFASDKLF